MNVLRHLAATLALALALPVMAQAAPLLPNANNAILLGELYGYDETVELLAGLNSFTFGLTPQVTQGTAISTNIALLSGGLTFDSFVITGPGGPFPHTALFQGDLGFIAAIQNVVFEVGEAYDLTLSFILAEDAATQVNVQLQAVPLPAGGLLLLGAMGGLGLMARRKIGGAA